MILIIKELMTPAKMIQTMDARLKKINTLFEKDKVLEISRMMSGAKQSELSVMHANELLSQSKLSKKKIREAF